MFACPRSDIDYPISGSNGLFIMFDHNQGVAKIAQTSEGIDQTSVIALVKSDRWFIQNVENADKARANLSC